MSKKTAKELAIEMALATPGTDITDIAHAYKDVLNQTEQTRVEDYAQNREDMTSLSDKDLSEILEQLSGYWLDFYSAEDIEQKLRKSDLDMVPALVYCGEHDLADRVVKTILASDWFDEKKHYLYHGRYSSSCGHLGYTFVSIEDQIQLVTALATVGRCEEAENVMAATKELLVDIDYLRPRSSFGKSMGLGIKEESKRKMKSTLALLKESGIQVLEEMHDGDYFAEFILQQSKCDGRLPLVLNKIRQKGVEVKYESLKRINARPTREGRKYLLMSEGSYIYVEATFPDKISEVRVMPYVDTRTGRTVEDDGRMGRPYWISYGAVSDYLRGELALGNEDLVSTVLKSLGADYCNEGRFGCSRTSVAARYLRMWANVRETDEKIPLAIEQAQATLGRNYIEKWDLYRPKEASYDPKLSKLQVIDQLSVALLHLFGGHEGEARKLLTATVNAEFYKDGKFKDIGDFDDTVCRKTNAMGIYVLKSFVQPEIEMPISL